MENSFNRAASDSSAGRQIQCGAATLMDQAPDTAQTYLVKAIRYIDRQFGDGYAKKNPALVGEFMRVSAMDLHSSFILLSVEKIEEILKGVHHDINLYLDHVHHAETD